MERFKSIGQKLKTPMIQKTILLFVALIIATPIVAPADTFAQDSFVGNLRWREVGPTATGGRVTDIAVDPNNVHHIFVASAAGGLWETNNNGTTWSCIFENEGTTTIGDIALDPKDVKTIWVGTGESNNQRSSLWGDGVYKTTDGGETWTNMGLKDSHHIGRVVVDSKDSNTVYVAALGHLYSSNEERGLFKTTDGGESWEKVLYVNDKVGVVDCVVDPNNPNIIFAATYERLRRAWNFDGAGPGSDIYRSKDAGKTWEKLQGGLPVGELGRIGLSICAKDPNIIYAAVSNQNPAAPGSAPAQRRRAEGEEEEFRNEGAELTSPGWTGDEPVQEEAKADEQDSDDPDADESDDEESDDEKEPNSLATKIGLTLDLSSGAAKITKVESFAARSGIRVGDVLVSAGGFEVSNVENLREFLENIRQGDRVEIVYKRGDADNQTTTLAAAVATQSTRQIGGEIYRSDDGGDTWKKMNSRPVGGSPAYYYGQIRVDPQDDQQIYVLSVPVYVSSNGGKDFASNGAPSVHVDHHAFWINPENSNHLMLGNDGGFHISYDKGKTWDYVFNLPLAQFYAITADMQEPYHVYGGLQDNGSWGGPSKGGGSGVSRSQWYRVGGGDGFYVQVDPEDSDLVISESQFGAISRANRKTGERKSIRPPQSEGSGAGAVRDRYNWNSPILMSQHDPRVVYFGGNKLFMSYNRGDDWQTISPDLTTAAPEKVTGNVPHCTITTIAESAQDKNMLMVGTDDGKVHVTTDRGKSWTDLSGNFPFRPTNWWCSRVEISSKDKKTVFVSFTGYREDDFRPFVFMTKDGGESWTSIASNLPEGCVNVIKQDPRNDKVLYVGTEFSAYVSLNQGESWEELNNGLPRVSVQDLMVHPRDRDLIIGTHGRGIYILENITPIQEFSQKIEEKPAHLFSIRDYVMIPRTSATLFAGDRKRVSRDPRPGAWIYYHFNEDVDEKKASMTIYDENDKKVADLPVNGKAGLHRTIFPTRSGAQSRFRRRRGPSISQGTYSVVLKVGDKEFKQKLVVRGPKED